MKKLSYLLILFCAGLFSCTEKGVLTGDDVISAITEPSVEEPVLGIPLDSEASASPVIDNPTVTLPNFQCSVTEEEGHHILNIDITGIYDAENNEWLQLFGTGDENQNVWLEIDGKPKGILVYNSVNGQNKTRSVPSVKAMADVVFLVDNSGSMSEEANAVARDIIDWASNLSTAESEITLDLQFGCVGYGAVSGVNGAINLADVESVSSYLNRSSGTARTVGFGGNDADNLKSLSSTYTPGSYGDECGVCALRFADENFSFRTGALRTYINFTDEPNFPNNNQG